VLIYCHYLFYVILFALLYIIDPYLITFMVALLRTHSSHLSTQFI